MRVQIVTTLLVNGQEVRRVVVYDNAAWRAGDRLRQTQTTTVNGTRVRQTTPIDQIVTAPVSPPPPPPASPPPTAAAPSSNWFIRLFS